jgi:hypothetical protein
MVPLRRALDAKRLSARDPSGDKIGEVEERERRIGRNEALFREVNERIERVTEALQVKTDTIQILCECGNESCMEQISVPLPEYERVRSDAELFFICSGHQDPEAEAVVEQHESYDIVRKKPGPAAEIARKLDPRDD